MPWLETDVRDQRIQFVVASGARTVTSGTPVGRSDSVGPPATGRWRRSLLESAAASQSPPHAACAPRRVAGALRVGARSGAVIGGRRPCPDATGYRHRRIQREGWTRPDAAPAPALHRFAHAAPNDLWQMDAKGAYPLADRHRCHTLSVLDDHSRFVVYHQKSLWSSNTLSV